jgi:anti-anti-sigma factor
MLSGRFAHWRSMTVDLLVILLVATTAIATSLVAAVGIGVAVTILSFLFTMSRSVVRRAYRGDTVHSRKTRDPKHMDILLDRGGKILVFELEGPIFFGTAEALSNRVDAALREGVSVIVLDLKRVNEIDSTGARILLGLQHRLGLAGVDLLVSHADAKPRVAAMFQDMGVAAALTPERIFDDTDRALEWAEDRLIASALGAPAGGGEYALDRLDMLGGLDAEERRALEPLLVRRTYAKGEAVFREGDSGRDLFIISRGTASVKIRLNGPRREHRLTTFSAGTVFGEVALLDGPPRSATVEADEPLVCYVLTGKAFDTLARGHESVAIKLLTNLGRELSRRLRRANRTIYELES